MYRPDPDVTARILIVEREPVICDALEMMLVLNGYRAHGARDGRAALEHLRESRCALVIVDLAACGMDGGEFVREVRALAPAPEAAVLLVGADSPDAISPPADACLPRPFEWGALLRQVTRLLPRVPACRGVET